MTLTSLISQERSTTGLHCRPQWVETSPEGGNKEQKEVKSRAVIDMDDSSQSDVSPCQPSHAHTFSWDTLPAGETPTIPSPPLLSPDSPERLITWAAFQRTSDYSFSTAPQAERWRMREEEVLAQLAGHGCSETTVLHVNQFPTMHFGNSWLWLA